MRSRFIIIALIAATLACPAPARREVNPRLAAEMPPKFLWAWERPEDLRFLDPAKFGVAFLAQTLVLTGDDVVVTPRRQPLELPDGIYVVAVTRIETAKEGPRRPTFSAAQRGKVVELIKRTLSRPNVRAIQTDFDVTASERGFYRELAGEIRRAVPDPTPFTMTSLASWCVGDRWFSDFPVDEAVPMAFEMGADAQAVKDFLTKGNDWNEPLCRGSYGFSVDDPIPDAKLRPGRRVYYFKSSAWRREDLARLGD